MPNFGQWSTTTTFSDPTTCDVAWELPSATSIHLSDVVTSPYQASCMNLCGIALALASLAGRKVTRRVSCAGAALLCVLVVAGAASSAKLPPSTSLGHHGVILYPGLGRAVSLALPYPVLLL